MQSDNLRDLVLQARRNICDPAFLTQAFDRMDHVAADLESIEQSALVLSPALRELPDNVVRLSDHRRG